MKQGKMIRYGILAGLCGCLGLPPAQAAVTTNLFEYFETNTVGTVPAGWTTGGATPGYYYVTNDLSRSNPNSLLMVNTNSPQQALVLKSLGTAISTNLTDLVEVRFSLNLAQVNATVNARLQDAVGFNFIQVTFNNAGFITASGTNINLAAYQPNQWYDVVMEFRPSEHHYDLRIYTNQTLVAGHTDLALANVVNFNRILFNNFGVAPAGTATSAHIDSVYVITGIPEPGTLGLMSAAAALLAIVRRRTVGRHSEKGRME